MLSRAILGNLCFSLKMSHTMNKVILSGILVFYTLSAWSQSRKQAKMAPVYAEGYYVSIKKDTLPVRIQINAGDGTDFYREFYFVSQRVRKPKHMNAQN